MSKSTRVTIEFEGRLEIQTQGWSDQTKLEQIKKQAKDEVSHWVIMIKKGSLEPEPFPYIRSRLTEVIFPI